MKRKIKKIIGDVIWIACYKSPLRYFRRMRNAGDAAWVWGFRDWYVHDQLTADKSCESCDRFEKGGYCLLHGRQIKNADIHTCGDFISKDVKPVEYRTEILGKWENPTEAVHAALRCETPATRAMVKFCNEAAHDAEAFGDYDLARENREHADRLKRMEIEQRLENNEIGQSDEQPTK